MSENFDQAKFANVGKDVELKGGITIRVKDLSLESIFELAEHLPELLEMVENTDDSDTMGAARAIITNPKTRQVVYLAISKVSSLPKDAIPQMGAGDLLKVVKTFLEVVDMEELRSVFTELGLDKMFRSLREKAGE
jgi:hypothetical protein